LRRTAAEVQKAFEKRRAVVLASAPVGAKAKAKAEAAAAALPEAIGFTPVPGFTTVSSLEADLKALSLDQLLDNSGDDKLTDACRKSLELLRVMRAASV
jgi:aryl-alcohol dehydrogenase-like predicted oxidoreductase